MRLLLLVLLLPMVVRPTPIGATGWGDPQAGRPVMRIWNSADYGAAGINWCLVRDARGFIYVGNDAVLEFDGRRWSRIAIGDAYAVRCLTVDPENRIWVGAFNEIGLLECDADGHRAYRSLTAHVPAGVPIGDVWNVFRLGNKTLFVLKARILIWDGTRIEAIEMPNERRLFSFRHQNGIAISQPGHRLWRWTGGALEHLALAGAESDSASFIARLADGTVLSDPGGRLARIDGERLEWLDTDASAFLNGSGITRAVALPNGFYAISTFNRGVLVLDPYGAAAQVIDRSNGLPGLNCVDLLLDNDRDLWIATTEAIIRMDATHSFTLFDASNGLASGSTRRIKTIGDRINVLSDEALSELRPSTSLQKPARMERVPRLEELFRDAYVLPSRTTLLSGRNRIVARNGNDIDLALTGTADFFSFARIDDTTVAVGEGSSIIRLDHSDGVNRAGTLIANLGGHPGDLTVDDNSVLWVATWRDGIHAAKIRPDGPVEVRVFHPSATFSTAANDPRFFLLDGNAYVYNSREVHRLSHGTTLMPEQVLTGIGLAEAERSARGSLWAVARRGDEHPHLVKLTARDGGLVPTWIESRGLDDIGQIKTITRDETASALWIGGSQGLLRIELAALTFSDALTPPRVLRAIWRSPGVDAFDVRADTAIDFHPEGQLRFDVRDGTDILDTKRHLESRLTGAESEWTLTTGERAFLGLREGSYHFEVRAVHFDGTPGPIAAFPFTITPPWQRSAWAYAGYLALAGCGIIGAVRFRTRRVARLNAQLERLVSVRTEELTRAVTARSAFLANMGHEIRNPLNGVVGLVDTLRARGLAADQKAVVDRLGNCATQLVSVVEDVLEFSRVDAGRIAVNLRPFHIREPIEASIDIFGAATAHASIEVRAEPDDFNLHTAGDPDRVRQVLVNYLANALKFGGNSPVTIAVVRRDSSITFSVTDRGPGIPPDEQARLFMRFSRGSAAYRTNIPGTGLGLAACKAYAEAMGGEVWVQSTVGEGSTFFLRIPYREVDEFTSIPTVVAPDIMVGRLALVVDDHEFNRMVLSDLLGRMGATACCAESVAEAKKAFSGEVPDVVFVDFDLGGPTGADFTRWIRSGAPAGRDVPVVATSAFEVDEVRKRCEDAGMDGFIAKPVTPQKVSEVMARIEAIRAGGVSRIQGLPTAPAGTGFLDVLARGDPARRSELERKAWSELLLEALATSRALRRDDLAETARRSHRLISSALLLSLTDVIGAAKRLNRVALEADAAGAGSEMRALRTAITRARRPTRR